ncbi:MAG TPA: hypothetical protein VHE30_17665 [Polyangiaceae bacterium]|nr:hypothetical protein [Polyangiaceae bacterium]
MTSRPPRDARAKRLLPVAPSEVGPGLARHPADGWQLASPRPLGPYARRVLRALVSALCPGGDAPRSPELDLRVEESARVFLSYMHPVVAALLAVGLVVLDFLALLAGTSTRLHRMPANEASRVLARFSRSSLLPLRLLVRGVRSLVLSVYFDQGEVHRALRYAPVPFIAERVKRRTELMNPRLPVAAE